MIKIPNNSPASKFTQHQASTLRIKDEIKYLYTKEQKLNQQLLHLTVDFKSRNMLLLKKDLSLNCNYLMKN